MPAQAIRAFKKKKEASPPKLLGHNHRFISVDLALLESGNLADVKVICGDRSWNLHQLILTTRCRWFEAALNGSFMESQTRVIKIEEFSPDFVDIMIRYIYSGGGLNIPDAVVGEKGPLSVAHIKAWAIADFFLLEPMKEDSFAELKSQYEGYVVWTATLSATDCPETTARVVEELSAGVQAAYHDYPHAKPVQRLLVEFAFASRLRLLKTEGFMKLVEREVDFGHAFWIKSMRSREVQYFGLLDPAQVRNSKPMSKKCGGCKEWYFNTSTHTHIWDDEKSKIDTEPAIRWTCSKCPLKLRLV